MPEFYTRQRPITCRGCGTILKADGHSRRVARAYLDCVVKWEEG